MAQLNRTAASLRMSGEDLDPNEITELIGKPPSIARKKGDKFKTPKGKSIIARTGLWAIKVDDKVPGNINDQIAEILKGTTQEVEIWLGLSKRFEVEIFCGLFLEYGNEGLDVSSNTMKLLGSRGIALDLDIYGTN